MKKEVEACAHVQNGIAGHFLSIEKRKKKLLLCMDICVSTMMYLSLRMSMYCSSLTPLWKWITSLNSGMASEEVAFENLTANDKQFLIKHYEHFS